MIWGTSILGNLHIMPLGCKLFIKSNNITSPTMRAFLSFTATAPRFVDDLEV